ncbi:MAG: molybdopterin cofactor-binding domain-containing protein [Hyphomicrobiaceae bacterium]
MAELLSRADRRRGALDRRAFLVSASAMAGGLALGFRPASASGQVRSYAPFSDSDNEITSWIVIQPDETVIIRVARSEMGQGAFTSLPMLVAEELECDWARVRPEFVPPQENRRRKLAWQVRHLKGAPPSEELITHWGSMATGGSRGTRDSQQYLREAGAIARVMLVEAAAKAWNVSAFECTVAAGTIAHTPSGRKTTYGKVAAEAARIPPPAKVPLKAAKNWKLLGKPTPQLDTLPKVNGALKFAIDVRLPGMLYATIAQCPVFGGRLKSYDPRRIRARPGVRHVVRLDPATVCVIADSFWQAKTALDALPVAWDEGRNANVNSDAIASRQRDGLTAANAGVLRRLGDAETAVAAAPRVIEAAYGVPFLDHAAMEPMNCTAQVSGGMVEIWVGTQNGEAALAAAAKAAGVSLDRARVNMMHLGGGFGRRSYNDFITLAVLAAKQAGGRPVQLIYTREQDMTHGFYRPASQAAFKAVLNDKGEAVAMTVRLAGQSINAWHRPERIRDGMDAAQAIGFQADDFGYDIANLTIELAMRNTHVPPGVWRSVNSSQNAFYKECFVDEMAHGAGKDPLEFRRALLAKAPRHKRVLEAAAEKAGWSRSPPAGVFRGIALHKCYGSYQATVAEVSVSDEGAVRVHRLVGAMDCGHVVNPNAVEQQMAGAAVMAMTALLYGEITIEKGRVVQRNFDTYQMLRMSEMPVIENVLVPSLDFWGGTGEPGLPPVAPAICNAIFAATGKRIRTLPLKHHNLAKA